MSPMGSRGREWRGLRRLRLLVTEGKTAKQDCSAGQRRAQASEIDAKRPHGSGERENIIERSYGGSSSQPATLSPRRRPILLTDERDSPHSRVCHNLRLFPVCFASLVSFDEGGDDDLPPLPLLLIFFSCIARRGHGASGSLGGCHQRSGKKYHTLGGMLGRRGGLIADCNSITISNPKGVGSSTLCHRCQLTSSERESRVRCREPPCQHLHVGTKAESEACKGWLRMIQLPFSTSQDRRALIHAKTAHLAWQNVRASAGFSAMIRRNSP